MTPRHLLEPDFPRPLRLGSERRGEEATSYGDDERPSVHKSLCLAASSKRDGGGAASGTTLHQRGAVGTTICPWAGV